MIPPGEWMSGSNGIKWTVAFAIALFIGFSAWAGLFNDDGIIDDAEGWYLDGDWEHSFSLRIIRRERENGNVKRHI